MSTRISSALPAALASILILALAASGSPDQPANTAVLAHLKAQQTDAEDDGRVPCARGGGELQHTCTVEQARDADGLILTVRHPDGGFRRLRVTGHGRAVIAADGAEAAKVTVIGPAGIEVAVAGDRYRLPATVKHPGGRGGAWQFRRADGPRRSVDRGRNRPPCGCLADPDPVRPRQQWWRWLCRGRRARRGGSRRPRRGERRSRH